MKTACVNFKPMLADRINVFGDPLRQLGYKLTGPVARPEPGDVLVVWNRRGIDDELAKRYEAGGGYVLVVENGYMGKNWLGKTWYSVAFSHHAGRGRWPLSQDGDPALWQRPSRWDNFGEELLPWRDGGREIVVLGQRGIGEPGIASPFDWAARAWLEHGGRVRRHPGRAETVPLARDLENAAAVLTWSSGAALRALAMGVPTYYQLEGWIGAGAALPLREFRRDAIRHRSDAERLATFRRLAWAMWTESEIKTGVCFEHLFGCT